MGVLGHPSFEDYLEEIARANAIGMIPYNPTKGAEFFAHLGAAGFGVLVTVIGTAALLCPMGAVLSHCLFQACEPSKGLGPQYESRRKQQVFRTFYGMAGLMLLMLAVGLVYGAFMLDNCSPNVLDLARLSSHLARAANQLLRSLTPSLRSYLPPAQMLQLYSWNATCGRMVFDPHKSPPFQILFVTEIAATLLLLLSMALVVAVLLCFRYRADLLSRVGLFALFFLSLLFGGLATLLTFGANWAAPSCQSPDSAVVGYGYFHKELDLCNLTDYMAYLHCNAAYTPFRGLVDSLSQLQHLNLSSAAVNTSLSLATSLANCSRTANVYAHLSNKICNTCFSLVFQMCLVCFCIVVFLLQLFCVGMYTIPHFHRFNRAADEQHLQQQEHADEEEQELDHGAGPHLEGPDEEPGPEAEEEEQLLAEQQALLPGADPAQRRLRSRSLWLSFSVLSFFALSVLIVVVIAILIGVGMTAQKQIRSAQFQPSTSSHLIIDASPLKLYGPKNFSTSLPLSLSAFSISAENTLFLAHIDPLTGAIRVISDIENSASIILASDADLQISTFSLYGSSQSLQPIRFDFAFPCLNNSFSTTPFCISSSTSSSCVSSPPPSSSTSSSHSHSVTSSHSPSVTSSFLASSLFIPDSMLMRNEERLKTRERTVSNGVGYLSSCPAYPSASQGSEVPVEVTVTRCNQAVSSTSYPLAIFTTTCKLDANLQCDSSGKQSNFAAPVLELGSYHSSVIFAPTASLIATVPSDTACDRANRLLRCACRTNELVPLQDLAWDCLIAVQAAEKHQLIPACRALGVVGSACNTKRGAFVDAGCRTDDDDDDNSRDSSDDRLGVYATVIDPITKETIVTDIVVVTPQSLQITLNLALTPLPSAANLTLSPATPAYGSPYQATVQIQCGDEASGLTLRVVRSGELLVSNTCSIRDTSCSLTVPAASCGTVDVVEFIAAEDYFEYTNTQSWLVPFTPCDQ